MSGAKCRGISFFLVLKVPSIVKVRFGINLLIYIYKIRICDFVNFHVSVMGIWGMQGLNLRTKMIKS